MSLLRQREGRVYSGVGGYCGFIIVVFTFHLIITIYDYPFQPLIQKIGKEKETDR